MYWNALAKESTTTIHRDKIHLCLTTYSLDGSRKCISILGHIYPNRFMVSVAALSA
jgi:hypothetical protein